MGSLIGNSGANGFNAITPINDSTCAFDWGTAGGGGISAIEFADTPTRQSPAPSTVAVAGNNGAGTTYPDRAVLTSFKGIVPIGAWPTGYEISARGGSQDATTFNDFHKANEAYLYSGGAIIGNNGADGSTFAHLFNIGDPLEIKSFGGSEDDFAAGQLGFNKVSEAGFGVRWRSEMVHTNANSANAWLDYVFLNIHYKQTGVMLAM